MGWPQDPEFIYSVWHVNIKQGQLKGLLLKQLQTEIVNASCQEDVIVSNIRVDVQLDAAVPEKPERIEREREGYEIWLALGVDVGVVHLVMRFIPTAAAIANVAQCSVF